MGSVNYHNQSGPPGAFFNIQRQSLGRAIAIGLTYFLAVRFSLLFPDSENVMAAVWPPSGIALGALLLRGHFRITEMAPDIGEYEGMYPLILK